MVAIHNAQGARRRATLSYTQSSHSQRLPRARARATLSSTPGSNCQRPPRARRRATLSPTLSVHSQRPCRARRRATLSPVPTGRDYSPRVSRRATLMASRDRKDKQELHCRRFTQSPCRDVGGDSHWTGRHDSQKSESDSVQVDSTCERNVKSSSNKCNIYRERSCGGVLRLHQCKVMTRGSTRWLATM